MKYIAGRGPFLLLFWVTAFGLPGRSALAQCFPDRVASFNPGINAGFGQGFFPGNVLGPPNGNSNPQTPTFTQQDLLTLGTGGDITLEFLANRIVDGPGPDFTVFENPVQPISDPNQSFVDSAVVEVSENGTTWTRFPIELVSQAANRLYFKDNYRGFAGVQPSLSSSTNGLSPFNPSVSGGDQFDLSDVGIPSARFVRIRDTGTTTVSPTLDKFGTVVNDYGNLTDPDPTQPGTGITAGFDLDAVAAINSAPAPSSACRREDWILYE